jgi:hypothetical protein
MFLPIILSTTIYIISSHLQDGLKDKLELPPATKPKLTLATPPKASSPSKPAKITPRSTSKPVSFAHNTNSQKNTIK